MSGAIKKALFAPRNTISRLVNLRTIIPARNAVYTQSGALLEKPNTVRLGTVKIILVVVPFVYLGAAISKNGAAFLEENDIFVPDDDDDD